MPKLFFITAVIMMLSHWQDIALAQNLVQNPSFEEYTTCPDGMGQIIKAINWKSYAVGGQEYYNECSSNSFSVPQNLSGYQLGADGNAYTGLFSYNPFSVNQREAIGTQLSSVLLQGMTYYIRLRISLAETSNCATNRIGVLFSTAPYSSSTFAIIKNYAHLSSTSIISDSLVWTKIEGFFTADSSYEYIAIGNFFDNNNTDTLMFGSANCLPYYFIDDICVATDSNKCNLNSNISERLIENTIEIYPNPVNDFFYIQGLQKHIYPVKIHNAQGTEVKDVLISNNNMYQISVANLEQGVYFITMETVNSLIYRKLIIIN